MFVRVGAQDGARRQAQVPASEAVGDGGAQPGEPVDERVTQVPTLGSTPERPPEKTLKAIPDTGGVGLILVRRAGR
jgi:hypothetical protein